MNWSDFPRERGGNREGQLNDHYNIADSMDHITGLMRAFLDA
jgi:hypothetical protein